MLRKASDLRGLPLATPEGRIGHVVDLFFDDRCWTMRYLVVATGSWLSHREVLISPTVVRGFDAATHALPVELSRAQVERSPTVDPRKPVTRDQELALVQYYNWPVYWGGMGFPDALLLAPPMPPRPTAPDPRATVSTLDEPHDIRSWQEVRGYRLQATDGEIGHIDDALIEGDGWTIAYLVVDTRNWLPGRRVLVPPAWVYDVGWSERKAAVDVPREAIRAREPYHPDRLPQTGYTDRPLARPERRSAEP